MRTLDLIKRGILSIPPETSYREAGTFILTGGKIATVTTPVKKPTLAQVIQEYLGELPSGAKADSTAKTEHIHVEHFKRLLGHSTRFDTIGNGQLQAYVNKRAKERGNKGTLHPATIKKELGTFSVLWTHARSRGWVKGDSPQRGLKLPKSAQQPPFMTWEQIERAIEHGENADLWDRLFLDEKRVWELLDYVKQHATRPVLFPAVAFAGLTGARLSEVLRSERSDFVWDAGFVLLREKKRKHQSSISFRNAPLFPQLASIMREWFDGRHPGGRYTVCDRPDFPLSGDTADKLLDRTLKKSKWKVLRGWHTLRHSFISIVAMRGTHQSIIDGWVGHQTDEQRARYRHLFPEQIQQAMNGLFRRDT